MPGAISGERPRLALRFTEGSAFNPFNFRASDRGRSFPAATAIPKRYGTVCGPVSEFTAFKKCYHYSGVWLERQGSNLHNWLMYTPQCVIHFHHVPLIAGLSRLPADRFYDGLLVNSAQPQLHRAA